MNYVEIEQRVRKVIKNQLELGDNVTLDDDDEILQQYGINSIDALELLLLLEKEFEVEIDDDDLNASLLSSIRSITEYFQKIMN